MENSIKSCIITRLIIVIASIILTVIGTVLFAFGILPDFSAILPLTAVIGLVIALAIFIATMLTRNNPASRYCVLCLGLMTQIAAIALLVLSLVAIALGFPTLAIGAIIFVAFFGLALWHTLLSFIAFVRCLAIRGSC